MLTRYQYPEIIRANAYLDQGHKTYAIPLYASRVSAGYPTSADDYIDQAIYLAQDLVKNPASTFLVIASGDSMINAGIQSGDMLVVDKQIEATNGRIVIAAIDSELTVKRLSIEEDSMQLLPENPNYKPILITPDQHVVIWGVVTFVIARACH
ncbi:MAG: translesion error-prone DNA polymerase V autoproteolytic subunit [Tatlockia sp.]|nr:translesion error-prone DNA polymerase V autoproteolytic subunit [Tatlockia sp.]